MTRSVLITGATGSMGGKIATHFLRLGWPDVRLLGRNPLAGSTIVRADLANWDDGWVNRFAGVDTVIHMAADPFPRSGWEAVQRLNVDLLMNVLEAARQHRVRRLVFASTNWVMAGYRFGAERLTTDLPPRPISPYGASKLFGERAGLNLAMRAGISFIAFRIGWCRREPGNVPGPDMAYGVWGQQMWLSDRDMCHAMERAIVAEHVPFAVLNLMSDNPGMRWDIDETRRVIGYNPQDGHRAVITDEIRRTEEMARHAYALSRDLEQMAREQRW